MAYAFVLSFAKKDPGHAHFNASSNGDLPFFKLEQNCREYGALSNRAKLSFSTYLPAVDSEYTELTEIAGIAIFQIAASYLALLLYRTCALATYLFRSGFSTRIRTEDRFSTDR
jgi:hypothetical protein